MKKKLLPLIFSISSITFLTTPLFSCNCGTSKTELVAISITAYPKMDFLVNESFNHDGIIITGTSSDGSKKDVTSECTFSTPVMSTLGTKDIEVTHISSNKKTTYSILVKDHEVLHHIVTFRDGEQECSKQPVVDGQKVIRPHNPTQPGKEFKSWTLNGSEFNFDTAIKADITLESSYVDANITSIVVTELPCISFDKGDPFISEEIEVTAIYDNHTTSIVTDKCTIVPPEMSVCGTHDVQVKYSDTIATTYKIVIRDPGVIYHYVMFMNDGSLYSTQPVKDGGTAFRPTEPTNSNKTFEYWYLDDESTPFDFASPINSNITLHSKYTDKKVSKIEIKTYPKVEFVQGDTFTHEGIAIEAIYDNSTIGWVTSECTFSSPDMTTSGTKKVTVTHNASSKTATYNIVVTDPSKVYYSVTFDSDGGSFIQSQKVEPEMTATKPSVDPTKTGYNFDKWIKDGVEYDFSTAITSNITLKATYTPSQITITATSEDESKGTVTGGKAYDYNDLATITATANSKYIFAGWYKDGSLVSSNPAYSFNVTNTDTYIAKFNDATIQLLSITTMPRVDFDVGETFNHEGIVVTATYSDGSTEDVTSNCDFSSPDMTTAGTKEVTITHTPSSTTTTYKIVVKAAGAVYKTVTFKTFYGFEVSEPVLYGTKAFKPENPTKADYKFKFWYKESELEEFDFNTTITSDITLLAKFDTPDVKLLFIRTFPTKIGFDKGETFTHTGIKVTAQNDDGVSAEQDVTNECSFSDPEMSTIGTKEVTITHTPSSKTIKYNIVVKDPTITYYSVTFNSNGGSSVESKIVQKDSIVAEPTAPTKTGCTFSKWAKEDGSDYDFNTPVTANITLNAVYNTNQITITAVSEDESKGTVTGGQTCNYNDKVTLTATAKPKYIFEGWTKGGELVSSDRIYSFNAKETASYKGCFKVAGIQSIEVTTLPSTIRFDAGATFNHDGIVITATHNDGSTEDVTSNCTYSSPNMSAGGEQTVTVTHTASSKTTTYKIIVVMPRDNFNCRLWSEVIDACNTFESKGANPTEDDAKKLIEATGVTYDSSKAGATVQATLQNHLVGLTGAIYINNQLHFVKCIDAMHDYISEGSTVTTTPAALTFNLITLLSDSNGNALTSIYDTEKSIDYIEHSTLRANLTGNGQREKTFSQTAFSMLPDILRNNIKTVKKSAYSDSSVVADYYDTLFPLTTTEINRGNASASLGTVYKYWTTHTADGDYAKIDARCNHLSYWLNCKHDSDTTVYTISDSGGTSSQAVTTACGVTFGFCI